MELALLHWDGTQISSMQLQRRMYSPGSRCVSNMVRPMTCVPARPRPAGGHGGVSNAGCGADQASGPLWQMTIVGPSTGPRCTLAISCCRVLRTARSIIWAEIRTMQRSEYACGCVAKRDWHRTQRRSTGLVRRSPSGSAHLNHSSADAVAMLADPQLVWLDGRRLRQGHRKSHRLGGVAAG